MTYKRQFFQHVPAEEIQKGEEAKEGFSGGHLANSK